MQISVIIPSRDSPMIDQVIAALRQQTVSPLEILVVGTDQSKLVLEDGLVRLLGDGRPRSPATARNWGAQEARGELICFTDSDCLAAPDWLERLRERHMQGAAVVGGGVRVEKDDYWRLCDNIAAFPAFLEDAPTGERPYLPSLNFSIRRDIFLKHGGFDERFPAPAGEDTDLCFRLRRAGYLMQFEPHAIVTHRHPRASPGELWRHLWRFGKTYAELHPRYPDLLGARRKIALSGGKAGRLRLLAPGLALVDIAERCLRNPYLLRYWQTLPGLWWGQLAWYDGNAAAMNNSEQES